jgi:hypothetical protein
VVLLKLIELSLSGTDLSLELLSLFLRALSLGMSNRSVHLLDIVIGVILKLLLSLGLNLQLVDGSL